MRLVFVHVPKTGGTAITAAFRKSFGADRVFRAATRRNFSLNRDELRSFEVVSAPVPPPYLRTQRGSALYCTMLRAERRRPNA
jgi:hypothetical protein